MQLHRFAEASVEIDNCIRLRPDPTAWGFQAIVYGESGRSREAHQAFAKFEQYARQQKFDPERIRLWFYIATGRKDQAMALLQKTFTERSTIITGLKVDPFCDPLRSDPRFQDLLRRAGLAN